MTRTTSYRWLPWWGALLLAIPVFGGTAAVLAAVRGGSTSIWQTLHFFLFIYLWIVLTFNRTRIEIDAAGVTIRRGPVWCGCRTKEFYRREDVTRLMMRHFAGPKNTHSYHATAVTRDDDWVDVSEGFGEAAPAQAEALEIAKVWNWPGPVASVDGFGGRRNWRVGLMAAGWGGAFVLALAVAVYIEILPR